MKVMRMSSESFTLTPALSMRERENFPQSPTKSGDRCRFDNFAASRIARWLFPLPAGEGQGEGEPRANDSVTKLL
jgi:hypothetical protein